MSPMVSQWVTVKCMRDVNRSSTENKYSTHFSVNEMCYVSIIIVAHFCVTKIITGACEWLCK